MKILLDECVDQRLARFIEGHEVDTVSRRGWKGTKNGALLALAADSYEVFVTTDRNLAFQQNLPKFDIAVAVLVSTTNRLAELRLLVPDLLRTLPLLKAGEVRNIGI